MILLAHTGHLEGATSAWTLFDGHPVVCCGNGHRAGIPDHETADDGTITPSLKCPEEGCDWHEMAQLEDWPGTP